LSTVANLMVKINSDTSGLNRGLADTQNKVQNFGRGMSNIGAAATMGITAPIVAGVAVVGKLTNEAMGFQQQMNEVFTLMPGITGPAMDTMTADVLGFAKEMGVIPNEVAPALYQAISAGVPADNVFSFLETAQKAAVGGVTDLTTAVDGISTVVNSYGEEIMDADKASDLMFTAVRLGKTTFEELSASLFNVLPSASALGVTFEEVTAAMATMTAQGVPTSVATTQMRQMLVELSKEGGKTAALFEELSGKSFKDFIASGGDVGGALAIMDQYAKDNNQSINDLFGSVEAGNAALQLSGENAQSYADNLREMQGAAGATDEAFEKMEQGVGRQMERLKAEFEAAKIEIGNKFLPMITDVLIPIFRRSVVPALEGVADMIKKMAEWFERLSPQVQKTVLKSVVLAVALGPVLWIGGKIVTLLGGMITGLGWLGRALRLAIGFIKLKVAALAGLKAAMALMSGPAGWIALAVVAIGLIAIAWYKSTRDSEDAMKAMRKKVEMQMAGMAADIKAQLVQQTQMIIDEYKSLDDQTSTIFQGMADGRVDINAEGFETLMTELESEKSQKLSFLSQQKKEELNTIATALEMEIIKTDEEAKRLRGIVDAKYGDLESAVISGYEQINSIVESAVSEERALTEIEASEILKIKEGMYNEIIGRLENYVADYKRLEALRGMEVNAMTASQLAEYKKIVEKTHNDMKTDLESTTEEALTIIETMFRDGTISATEYDISYREIMNGVIDTNLEIEASHTQLKKEIIARYKELYSGVFKVVRMMSFDIFGLFDWLYKVLVGGSIVPDMVNAIIGWFERLKSSVLDTWNSLVSNIISKAQEMKGVIDDVLQDLMNLEDVNISASVSSDLKTALSSFDTGGIVPGPIGQPQLAVVHGGETVLPTHKTGFGGESRTVNFDLNGLFAGANISIGSEEQAREVAREIFRMAKGRALSEGVAI
jgi:TP901 family phage tail tape measure protein